MLAAPFQGPGDIKPILWSLLIFVAPPTLLSSFIKINNPSLRVWDIFKKYLIFFVLFWVAIIMLLFLGGLGSSGLGAGLALVYLVPLAPIGIFSAFISQVLLNEIWPIKPKRKRVTLLLLGGFILITIILFGDLLVGRNASAEKTAAVKSVSVEVQAITEDAYLNIPKTIEVKNETNLPTTYKDKKVYFKRSGSGFELWVDTLSNNESIRLATYEMVGAPHENNVIFSSDFNWLAVASGYRGIYLIKLDGSKIYLLQHPACQKISETTNNYNLKEITINGTQIEATILCQNHGELRWGEDGIYLNNRLRARNEKPYFKFVFPTNEL